MELPVKVELLQAVANYLTKQPWGEVNPLLVELSKLSLPKESAKTDGVETVASVQ